MLQSDAPLEVLDEVIVAGGEPRSHKAWAGLEVAANGDLLVAYKDGSDHARTDDAVVMLARSTDGGRTWPTRKVVAAEPGWSCYCNHGMTRLSDGTLLLEIIRSRHLLDALGQRRNFSWGAFIRSTDDGHLWQERGPELDLPFVSHYGHGFCYGRVRELSDGRLMMPFHGVPRGAQDAKLRVVAVVFSEDRGHSWNDYSIIYEDRQGDICPSECDLLRLPDGRYLAMIRANAALRLYRSYSEDEGRSWTPIEPTDLPGQSPALIYLASGDILCAYRDVRPDQLGMSCAVSSDFGQTWVPLGHLYRGANRDCAYPSMVHLPGGRIYCTFYTAAEPEAMTGSCEIHGLILRDRTAA